jgi:glycosyltransferase involved in cell wall biosynthesis
VTPHICFVSAEHPPLDKRVFHKEARSLAGAGYTVTHLCPDDGEGSRWVDGVHIVTYRRRRRDKLGRLIRLISLYRRSAAINASSYHCNEPDSWVVGLVLRAIHRRPVVFDCHEYYPAEVRRSLPPLIGGVGWAVTTVLLQLFGLFTDLIVLAKYSVESDFSLSRRRELTVLNTTSLTELPSVAEPHVRPAGGPYQFVHTGVIRRERGSEELLQALAELRGRGLEARIVVVGEFKDGSESQFFAKAEQLGVRSWIEFHRWLPFAESFSHVRSSDAGLILFKRELEGNVRGMPHKMFDYMLAGLPVIAPDFAPDIATVLSEAGAGLLVDTDQPNAIADAMQQLITTPDLGRKLGASGQRAVFDRYNWEVDAAKLIDAYTRLVGPPAPRSLEQDRAPGPKPLTTSFSRSANRAVYLARGYSWMADPRLTLCNPDGPIHRPIFLLGTQGGGLTLLSRILRRNPHAVSAAGGPGYWTAPDEIQNLFGLYLPQELSGMRYKAPPHPEFPLHRSWTYAARDLLPEYRKRAADATPEARRRLRKVIRYCGLRHNRALADWRFIDKSQSYTVRVGLLHNLLSDTAPCFVLVTREPYVSVIRAADGGAADMRALASSRSLHERLDICAEHYANSIRAVVEDVDECGIELLSVRFEDLLAEPEKTTERVCEHLDLSYHENMLPHAGDLLPIGSQVGGAPPGVQLDPWWYPLRREVNQRYEPLVDEAVLEAVNRHFDPFTIEWMGYAPR